MSSTSETGHAKNVANFYSLIEFLKSYGASYNPSKNDLKINRLQALFAEAQIGINNVVAQYGAYNNTVNIRQSSFATLKPLATRIINALQSTNASELVVKDAKTANRKIQGQRASTTAVTSPLPPDTPAPNTISASQLSYTNLVQHFANLIAVLENDPNYAPNENDLNIVTLKALNNQLSTLNNQVATAFTAISTARLERNVALYNQNTGICDIALEVKQYVKSLFGAQSPQYNQIKSIQFRHYKL